jgi:hypothetical protein
MRARAPHRVTDRNAIKTGSAQAILPIGPQRVDRLERPRSRIRDCLYAIERKTRRKHQRGNMLAREAPLSRSQPGSPLRLAGVRLVARLRPSARSFRLSEWPFGRRAPQSRYCPLPSAARKPVAEKRREIKRADGSKRDGISPFRKTWTDSGPKHPRAPETSWGANVERFRTVRRAAGR